MNGFTFYLTMQTQLGGYAYISVKWLLWGGEVSAGIMPLHGRALAAASRLIPVFSGEKESVHEEHAECLLALLLLSLSLSEK